MASLESLYDKYKCFSSFEEAEDTYIGSGSVILDQILSNGKGIPMGKWIQLTSESGCGKSHIVLHAAKAFCARNKKVVYIDDEKGLNESQLDGIGLTKYLGTLFFPYPISTYEEAEQIMDAVVEDPEVALIVIDSITGLVPEKLINNSVASTEPGLQARYAATFLIKYRTKISRSVAKPAVILVNQTRTHISFTNTTVGEAGGKAQQFYTDIRLMMRCQKDLTRTVETMEGKKSVKYGTENLIWATKNRHAAPFVQGVITILFGQGVSNLAAYQRFLMSEGVLKMSGAGYWKLTIPDKEEKGARGSNGVLQLIKENLADIKEFVQERGGFNLVKTTEGEGE